MKTYEFLRLQLEAMLSGPMSLQRAIVVAALAHGKQEDRGGNAYIRHPLRVMEQMQTEDEMICAILHDALEDTDLTVEHLQEIGCTASQIKIIEALTKREGQDHEQYLTNIEKSPAAKRIKILDMKDNSRLDRLKNRILTPKDVERMQRYITDLHRFGGLG